MIVALRAVPETAPGGKGGWHVQRPGVYPARSAATSRAPRSPRPRYGPSPAACFLSVIPGYAGDVLKTENLALLGLVTAIMLGCSCAAQVLVRRGAPAAQAQAGGLILLTVGLLGLVLATPLHAPGLLVGGAAVAGAGHGLAFLAAQDDLTRIAPDDHGAEVSAAFYVCIYLGVAVPVIGIGVLAAAISLYTAIAVFAAVTGSAAIVTAAWHLHHRSSP